MLEPLLQLRGEWRQAAAISVPASAGEVAELLDKAIDVLDANSQLDEESLLMAADMICKAVPARADVIAILRMRLVRAAHDFAMVTAVENAGERESGSGPAFESEEALAAALFAGAGIKEEEVVVGERERDPSRPRIDSRGLQKSLMNWVPWWRRRWFLFARRVVLLAVVAGVLFYVYKNPPQLFTSNLVVQNPTGPSASGGGAASPPSGNTRTGTFAPHSAICDLGGVSAPAGNACSWPLKITSPGTLTVGVGWDDAAPVTVELLDASGKVVGGPATGSRAVSISVVVSAENYTLRVTNASATSDSIHFTAAIGTR